MSVKTYIMKNLREADITVIPQGKRNEYGAKVKSKHIIFRPNERGNGQYTTSDQKEQEYLENLPHIKEGRMVILSEHSSASVPAAAAPAKGKTQRVGMATSDEGVRG